LNKNINKRVIDIANHIILTKDTIRKTAVIFNVSKSTVHKDIGERLMTLDINKYQEVKKIMLNHLETRHLLGGESTRQLFLRKKQITL
jgi:regulatory protein, deoR